MKNTISGRVIRGDDYGKRLGFPTANLDRRQYARQKLNIRHGVYAGAAVLPSGKSYKAGIVVGPKYGKSGLPKLEAHLLNFRGNLYGQKVTLHLAKFLRPFRRYGAERELRRQIQRDINIIKKMKLYE